MALSVADWKRLDKSIAAYDLGAGYEASTAAPAPGQPELYYVDTLDEPQEGDNPGPAVTHRSDLSEGGLYREFIPLFNRAINDLQQLGPVAPPRTRGAAAGSVSLAKRIIFSAALSISQKISRLEQYFREVDAVAAELKAKAHRTASAARSTCRKRKERAERAAVGKKSPAHVKGPDGSPVPGVVLTVDKGPDAPSSRKKRRTL